VSATAPPLPQRDTPRLRLGGPAARTVLAAGVVVTVFAGVLPRIADYSGAWALVRALTGGESGAVAAVALVNLLSSAPLWMAALPGLTLYRAVLVDQASTAVANTVPVGFAFGVGTNVAMLHSFGFPAGDIARGIALTGIWNNLVKLGMPATALAGVALVGDVDDGLAIATVLGSAMLLLAVAGLVLVVTHGGAAAELASVAERLAGLIARGVRRPPPTGWVTATERFRAGSRDLLRARWPHLTAGAVASHAALFLVLLVCLRVVDGQGADVPWAAVLAVFSITRLVTIVPITPGALGVAELSYVAGLTAVGVDPTAATGAVLLFRFLTWFVPIPLGAVAWLLWSRGADRTAPAGTAR
jgi:uncharacterized membrane protein YbhN (UPF0104 family)